MAKRDLKITYQKAGRTPSARPVKKHPKQASEPPKYYSSLNGRNPLNKYIVENEGSGLPMSELIAQFQEYDCQHTGDASMFKQMASTPKVVIFRCECCGLEQRKERPDR